MKLRRTVAAGLIKFSALFAAVALSTPVAAEVSNTRHGGFASIHTAHVAATPWQVWEELIHPENWWTHTWSGDAMNLRLDPQAGGCFCEKVPSDESWETGSVEHGRVVAVFPEEMLRLSGSLGPLQSEGLVGTLTVTLAAADGGTRITWEYVVGGAARFDMREMAPVVDRVQGEFLGSFTAWLRQNGA